MGKKLDELIAKINKEHKSDVIRKQAESSKVYKDKIPFATPSLNWSLYGGLPRSILIEIAGGEGAGKSSLSESIVGEAQKMFEIEYQDELEKLQSNEKRNKAQELKLAELLDTGAKKCLWCDCEWTFDDEWARSNGIDISKLVFIKPDIDSAESIFNMIRDLANTGEFGLIVLDSIGILQSKADLEASYEDLSYGGIAKSLGRFSKDMVQICAKHNILFIGINQLRENLKSKFGGTMSVGGRSWRHNISLRMELRKARFIDEDGKELTAHPETAVGNTVDCEVTKNKICKPNRRLCQFTINYDLGIDSCADTFDMAVTLKVLTQAGAWFSLEDEEGNVITLEDGTLLKWQGKKATLEAFKNNPEIFKLVSERLNKAIES